MDTNDRLAYRVEEAAKLLAISRTMIYVLIRMGAIKAIPLGRVYRIPRTSLDAFMKTGYVGPTTLTGGKEEFKPTRQLKSCTNCGAEFPPRGRQKYCDDCRAAKKAFPAAW